MPSNNIVNVNIVELKKIQTLCRVEGHLQQQQQFLKLGKNK
jgi:hypothetical protein